jgi:hypothetical protein
VPFIIELDNVTISLNADAIVLITSIIIFIIIGIALGLNKEQALNAMANNCSMVLKHAIARKCRFLPLEVISRQDFKVRYPEQRLDMSQDFLYNIPARDEIVSFIDTVVKLEGQDDDEKVINVATLGGVDMLVDAEELATDDEDEEEDSKVPISRNIITNNTSRESINDNSKENDQEYEGRVAEEAEVIEEKEEEGTSDKNSVLFMSFSSSSSSSSSSEKRSVQDGIEDHSAKENEMEEGNDNVKNNSIILSSIQVNEVNDDEENNGSSGGFGSGDFISFSSESTTSKVPSNSNTAPKRKEGVKNNGKKGNSSNIDVKKMKKIKLR